PLGLVLRLGPQGRRTWPRRLWRAVAFPTLVSVATIGIWIGGLVHPDALHAHAGALLQPVAEVATAEQRERAAHLLADTRASITRYGDPAAAIAAGFKPGPAASAEPLRHFENAANAKIILDPNHPQALVYVQTKHGLQLIGAMYQMPRAGQWGPDPGGSLTQWHQHEGICFSPFGFEFSFETPFWTCPVGSTSVTTPPMLHVWIIDNGKLGPFAADLDKTVQKNLQGSRRAHEHHLAGDQREYNGVALERPGGRLCAGGHAGEHFVGRWAERDPLQHRRAGLSPPEP